MTFPLWMPPSGPALLTDLDLDRSSTVIQAFIGTGATGDANLWQNTLFSTGDGTYNTTPNATGARGGGFWFPKQLKPPRFRNMKISVRYRTIGGTPTCTLSMYLDGTDGEGGGQTTKDYNLPSFGGGITGTTILTIAEADWNRMNLYSGSTNGQGQYIEMWKPTTTNARQLRVYKIYIYEEG